MQTVPCPLPKLVPPKERCTNWLEVGLETIHNAGKENMEFLDPCPTITFANKASESLVSFIMIIIYTILNTTFFINGHFVNGQEEAMMFFVIMLPEVHKDTQIIVKIVANIISCVY